MPEAIMKSCVYQAATEMILPLLPLPLFPFLPLYFHSQSQIPHQLHVAYSSPHQLLFLKCWLLADRAPLSGHACSFHFCSMQISWLREVGVMRSVTEIHPIVLYSSTAQLASHALIYNLKLETMSCLSLWIKVKVKINIWKLFFIELYTSLWKSFSLLTGGRFNLVYSLSTAA